MRIKRKTQIIVDANRVVITPRRGLVGWCASCRGRVRMLTPQQVAALGGVTSRKVYQWVEANRFHFEETPEGLLLICLNSLFETTDLSISRTD